MKVISTIITITVLLFSQLLQAQNAGDYRTRASGLWSNSAVWQRYDGVTWQNNPAPPTSSDGVITIDNVDSIELTTGITIDEVVIGPSAKLAIYNGTTATTFTLNDDPSGDDIIVNGRLYISTNATLTGTGTIQSSTGSRITFRNLGRVEVTTTIGAGGLFFLAQSTIAALVTNFGNAYWESSNVSFNNGILQNDGIFNVTGNNALLSATGTNEFINNGTFIKSVGTGNTTSAIPFTNTGTLQVITGGFLNSTAGAVFNNTGLLDFNGTNFQNTSGTINLNTGTIINGPMNFTSSSSAVTNVNEVVEITNVTINAGTIAGTGELTIPGNFIWSAGTLDVVTILPLGAVTTLGTSINKNLNADLTNDGTINWNAGNITFNNAVLTNNAVINEVFSASQAFLNGSGTNSILNNGTINKTSVFSLTNNLNVPITNAGTLQGFGTYVFTGGITSNPGAVYSPGIPATTGVLSAGSAILSSNSTIQIEIGSSNTPGSGHDQLAITTGGAVTLAGTLEIIQSAGTPGPTGVYTIMTTPGSFVGAFDNVILPSNFVYLGIQGGNQILVQKIALFPLPLKWGSFKAIPENKSVVLYWTTLEEENTSYFVIEHSVNGRQYNQIGIMTANGNSNVTLEYKFVHLNPSFTSNNFYRIRQVDIDGHSSFSEVRNVNYKDGKAIQVQFAPNPVVSNLYVSIQEQGIHLEIFNTSGKRMQTVKTQQGITNISLSSFPSGVYYISVFQNGKKLSTEKIIKN